MLSEVRDASTAYLCVLCGSILNARDYEWGACRSPDAGTRAACHDWSCPVCGGVVVEYARAVAPPEPTSGLVALR